MRSKLFAVLTASVLALGSMSVFATYNANMTGVVTQVLTYTEGDQIYFRLDNQPSSHPACNANYFAVPAETSADRRKAVLARLLVAKTTGETVNIGYDNAGSCYNGYMQAYRIG